MEYKIYLAVSISLLSVTCAVSVDYYPRHEQHHPTHVKYIQPAHAEPIKYIQPAHVAHAKYLQHQPDHLKYVHQPEHVVKYIEKPLHVKHQVDYDEPAQYEYGYNVHDEHTGDIKSHQEKRDGDSVQGRYEVLDPDGFKRIVEYTADAHHGFNAIVRREPSDVKIVKKVFTEPEVVNYVSPAVHQPHYASPVVQPKYYAAPQQQKYFAPAVVHQTIKQTATPHYYATPEHPKYFKPVLEKVTKVVKPIYATDPHTSIKYVQPSAHYSHHY